jgi:hypothetical protein
LGRPTRREPSAPRATAFLVSFCRAHSTPAQRHTHGAGPGPPKAAARAECVPITTDYGPTPLHGDRRDSNRRFGAPPDRHAVVAGRDAARGGSGAAPRAAKQTRHRRAAPARDRSERIGRG